MSRQTDQAWTVAPVDWDKALACLEDGESIVTTIESAPDGKQTVHIVLPPKIAENLASISSRSYYDCGHAGGDSEELDQQQCRNHHLFLLHRLLATVTADEHDIRMLTESTRYGPREIDCYPELGFV